MTPIAQCNNVSKMKILRWVFKKLFRLLKKLNVDFCCFSTFNVMVKAT